MNVFADCHHGSLFASLELLFERRLHWELFRPIGLDWFTSGYWKIAEPYGNFEGTIKQFLDINSLPWSPDGNLNGGNYEKDGIYYIYDPRFNNYQKAITFEKFKEMDFDIIISSIPAHDICYEEMIRLYKPKAKHIAQMGNIFQTTEVKNVMCSTKPYTVPAGKNVVFYHQEQLLTPFSKPKEDNKRITSFVNCLPNPGMYEVYKSTLSDYEFKSYGIACPDGIISGEDKIVSIMSNSTFGFQNKPGADGFGHIIFGWFNVGRPVIINYEEYKDKLAGELLIPDKTCISLDSGDGFNAIISKIREYSQKDKYEEMCRDSWNRFRNVVDYEKEEKDIRIFLNNLL